MEGVFIFLGETRPVVSAPPHRKTAQFQRRHGPLSCIWYQWLMPRLNKWRNVVDGLAPPTSSMCHKQVPPPKHGLVIPIFWVLPHTAGSGLPRPRLPQSELVPEGGVQLTRVSQCGACSILWDPSLLYCYCSILGFVSTPGHVRHRLHSMYASPVS